MLQRHVENEIILSSSPQNKPQQVNSPKYSNHPSPKLSCFNSEESRRNFNSSQNQETTGIFHNIHFVSLFNILLLDSYIITMITFSGK